MMGWALPCTEHCHFLSAKWNIQIITALMRCLCPAPKMIAVPRFGHFSWHPSKKKKKKGTINAVSKFGKSQDDHCHVPSRMQGYQ